MCTISEIVVTTTSMIAVSPSTRMPTSRWSEPIWNHEMALSYGPCPSTKCHRTPIDITNAAPTIAMP